MVRKFILRSIVLTFVLSTFLWTGCSDNTADPAPSTPQITYYTFGIRAGGVGYLLPSSKTDTGSVSLTNAVEVNGFESNTYGNYIYTYIRAEKSIYQYEMLENGTVQQKAKILLSAYITDRAYSQSIIDGNTLLIIDPITWGLPEMKWVQISIPDFVVKSSGTLTLPTLEAAPGINWGVNVGKVIKHGNKLVMGTVDYDLDGNFPPGSYAITLDYPAMTNPQRIFSDKIDGELGIISVSSYAQTENGDSYLATAGGFSNGAALWGKSVNANKHGGILRIKKGETTFDNSYLLDLTQKLGKPTNIYNLHYVGNDYAIAMIFNPNEINGWSDLSNDRFEFAKIKLSTGDVTVYTLPKSASRLGRVAAIEGTKYINFYKSAASNKTNILTIDVANDKTTIGTQIMGDNVEGFMVAKYKK